MPWFGYLSSALFLALDYHRLHAYMIWFSLIEAGCLDASTLDSYRWWYILISSTSDLCSTADVLTPAVSLRLSFVFCALVGAPLPHALEA